MKQHEECKETHSLSLATPQPRARLSKVTKKKYARTFQKVADQDSEEYTDSDDTDSDGEWTFLGELALARRMEQRIRAFEAIGKASRKAQQEALKGLRRQSLGAHSHDKEDMHNSQHHESKPHGVAGKDDAGKMKLKAVPRRQSSLFRSLRGWWKSN